MTTAPPDTLAVPVVYPPDDVLAGIVRLREVAELVNKPQTWVRAEVDAREAALQVEQWHIPKPMPGMAWMRREIHLWALSMGLLGPVPYLSGLRVIGYAGIAHRSGLKVQSVRIIPARQRRPDPAGWERRVRMPDAVAVVHAGRARMPVFPLDDQPAQMGVETWLACTRGTRPPQ